MAMLSPGLALFLYGVSSIPEEGTITAPKVWVTMLIGGLLVIGFIFYSFKPVHPLLDLRLFKNYNLAISTFTMFMFAAAFFGGLLLVPTYFQQVRGESPLDAGLLVAPQGIGAMITMPIAGSLADKIPVGRIVPVGLVLIVAGMFTLTQVEADTSYALLIAVLFVMGLGMGATMMPLMTSALRTLKHAEVARGSTLLNITQQIASSVGVAVISVVLTNQYKDSKAITAAQGLQEAERNGVQPPAGLQEIAASFGDKFEAIVKSDMASAFGTSFLVAAILCTITLIASLFLPRKYEVSHLLDDDEGAGDAPPVVLH
jgi:EmrB/QacA subfamily drug resistance transporter